MKIDQLRQLLEIAKTKSINQAAMNLYISQPNLSMSMRKLEDELGYPLFIRNNRGIELTVKGEQFLHSAESVLLQFDRLKEDTLESSSESAESFSVGHSHYRYVTEAATSLFARRQKHAPFKLNIIEGGRESIIDMVYRGGLEIGVISIWSYHRKAIASLLAAKDIQFYRLDANPLSIVVGRGSPLYQHDSDWVASIKDLEGFPTVSYNRTGIHSTVSWILRDLGMSTDIFAGTITVNERATLMEAMEHTNAFMVGNINPKAYTHSDYYPNAKCFRLGDSKVICETGWIKRNDYVPTPLAMEFIHILSAYYA